MPDLEGAILIAILIVLVPPSVLVILLARKRWTRSAPKNPGLADHPSYFWRRFVGFVIDLLVVSVLEWLAGGVLPQLQGTGLDLLTFVAYFAGGYAVGATAGMRAVGLRVVDTNGAPIRPTTALLRSVCLLVVLLVVLTGVGLVIFLIYRRQGRPYWHDEVTKTYVVRQSSPVAGASTAPIRLGSPPPVVASSRRRRRRR